MSYTLYFDIIFRTYVYRIYIGYDKPQHLPIHFRVSECPVGAMSFKECVTYKDDRSCSHWSDLGISCKNGEAFYIIIIAIERATTA